MDPALEGVFDAPSTAQSSGAASNGGVTSTNTAKFGVRDGRAFNDDSPSAAFTEEQDGRCAGDIGFSDGRTR